MDIVMSAMPTAASAAVCAPFVRAGVPVIDIAAETGRTLPRREPCIEHHRKIVHLEIL